MLSGGLRLFLLLAVLVQYTPLRVCALERVAVGSSCHDWDGQAAPGEYHSDERRCGSATTGGANAPGGEHECLCEQPKVDAQHKSHAATAAPDWANLSVPAVGRTLPSPTRILALPDPVSDRATSASHHFPLLI